MTKEEKEHHLHDAKHKLAIIIMFAHMGKHLDKKPAKHRGLLSE